MERAFAVAFITDQNYAVPTYIALNSMIDLWDNDYRLRLYIICDRVSSVHKDNYYALASDSISVEIIDAYEERNSERVPPCQNENIYVSKSALLKFDLPYLCPKEKKLLYLDSDIIVNKNLIDLLSTDISDFYLAAVDDMGDTIIDEKKSLLSNRIGLPVNDYFNSGVMLLNLKKMREDNIVPKLWDYRFNGINYFMDQDTFNAVLCTARKKIPYTYNFRASSIDQIGFQTTNSTFFQSKYNSAEECIKDQSIIHLTDRLKPWKYNIPFFSEMFCRYYEKSPYRSEKLILDSALSILWQEKQTEIQKCNLAYNELEKAYKKQNEKLSYLRQCKSLMEWKFPEEKIQKGDKVIIYGAGEVGCSLVQQNQKNQYCNVVLWVDSNYAIKDEKVVSPDRIKDAYYDYILIALSRKHAIDEVKAYLLEELKVQANKIVTIMDI